MKTLNPAIVDLAASNGWTYRHAAAIYEGRTCRCTRCVDLRYAEKLSGANDHQRWAEDFKKRFHGGCCSHCGTRKAPFGRLNCAPCAAILDARRVAREAAERAEAAAEQAFEMRAAFGPGVEVVDIITGTRYRT